MTNETLKRWGFLQPSTDKVSGRGKPYEHTFKRNDVVRATRWLNSNGNPSYRIYLKNGYALFCVDDFGGENMLPVHAERVQRRKDL